MIKKSSKIFKFFCVIRKFWYVILISTICFGVFGYFVGEKKTSKHTPFVTEVKHYMLKTNIIISSGNYQDFSESFNNSCMYFMTSTILIEDSVHSVNSEISESEALKIISVYNINKVSNMIGIDIMYTSKEEAKQILDKYIEKTITYLNKTLKNNLNEDGTFKEGVLESDKILLTQIGELEYREIEETIVKKVTNVAKYIIAGMMIGLIFGLIVIYFTKFYFLIHCPVDIVKNFEVDYIGMINSETELVEYIEKNENQIFCSGNNIELTTKGNFYTKEQIFNSDSLELGEEKNLIILVKEGVDTFFYVEKVQMILKNKIRGFILYK